MGRVHPLTTGRVGLGWVGLGRVEYIFFPHLVDRVGSGRVQLCGSGLCATVGHTG